MKEDVNVLNLYILRFRSTFQWHQNCLRFLNMPVTEHPHAVCQVFLTQLWLELLIRSQKPSSFL